MGRSGEGGRRAESRARRRTRQSILDFARQRIAGYKVPKAVDFVAELPRNASGKILKRELRKPYWEGRERQVN